MRGVEGADGQPAGRRAMRRRRGAETGPAAEAGAGDQAPGMLKDDEPVNVTAKHLVYDSETGQAAYTGDARLWQGETSIKARHHHARRRQRQPDRDGNVRSTMRLEPREEGAKPGAAAGSGKNDAAQAASTAATEAGDC